jgi:AraC-like DNA-binding protein
MGNAKKKAKKEAASPADDSEDAPAHIALNFSSAILRLLEENITSSLERDGVSNVVLGQNHIKERELPEGVNLTRQGPPAGEVVRPRGYIYIRVAQWAEAGMEALRFPCFIFIYGGEADIPVGDAVLHCPKNTIIVVPPGVPHTQGLSSHWNRPGLENASSDILWITTSIIGAELHLCHTRGQNHDNEQHSRLLDRRLLPLAEQLILELESSLPFSKELAKHNFLTLLYMLQRHGRDTMAWKTADDAYNSSYEPDTPSAIINRAKVHIDRHIADDLSLESIARGAYVSRARLTQLFRDETQQTVWDYVTARRIQEARTTLEETNICVRDVARLCGFSHQSHFFARFAEANGMTPGEWRKRARREGAAEEPLKATDAK